MLPNDEEVVGGHCQHYKSPTDPAQIQLEKHFERLAARTLRLQYYASLLIRMGASCNTNVYHMNLLWTNGIGFLPYSQFTSFTPQTNHSRSMNNLASHAGDYGVQWERTSETCRSED